MAIKNAYSNRCTFMNLFCLASDCEEIKSLYIAVLPQFTNVTDRQTTTDRPVAIPTHWLASHKSAKKSIHIMSIGLSLWTNMQSCIICIRLIILEQHCKKSMPRFHNYVSSMYMAYKAFAFYQFSFGANKQIFLLVILTCFLTNSAGLISIRSRIMHTLNAL